MLKSKSVTYVRTENVVFMVNVTIALAALNQARAPPPLAIGHRALAPWLIISAARP